MTRGEKDRNKRLAQIRRANRTYRKKLKAKRDAAEKAKRSGGYTWRRPHDPRPGQDAPAPQVREEAPIVAPSPTPVPAPKAPSRPPKLTTLERKLAADRLRCDRAATRALKADDALLAKLDREEDKLRAEHEQIGFVKVGDGGLPEEVFCATCRICGRRGEWTKETSFCCSGGDRGCIDVMTFSFGGWTTEARFVAREPQIRAAIAKLARRAATRLKVKCAECGRVNVPDPENTQREDLVCDRCYRRLDEDGLIDGRMRRMLGRL